jgi:DNA-binding transcriptional regulator YdaS (Cro superfamily)
MQEKQSPSGKITRLSRLIDSVCGTYSRIARRLGVHRTYVSRVANGERRSPLVESALISEYERIQKSGTGSLEE